MISMYTTWANLPYLFVLRRFANIKTIGLFLEHVLLGLTLVMFETMTNF